MRGRRGITAEDEEEGGGGIELESATEGPFKLWIPCWIQRETKSDFISLDELGVTTDVFILSCLTDSCTLTKSQFRTALLQALLTELQSILTVEHLEIRSVFLLSLAFGRLCLALFTSCFIIFSLLFLNGYLWSSKKLVNIVLLFLVAVQLSLFCFWSHLEDPLVWMLVPISIHSCLVTVIGLLYRLVVWQLCLSSFPHLYGCLAAALSTLLLFGSCSHFLNCSCPNLYF